MLKMSEVRERVSPNAVTLAPLGAVGAMAALSSLLYGGGDDAVREKLLQATREAGVGVEELEGAFQAFRTSVGPGEDGKAIMQVGRNAHPAVIAHEMGHLTEDGLGRALRVIDPVVPGIQRSASLVYGAGVLPFLSGLLAGRAWSEANDEEQSDDEKLHGLNKTQLLNAVSAVPYLPTVLEEGRASVQAAKMISRLQGRGAGARAALRLAPALGTYAATLGFPAMSAVYAQGLKNEIKERGQEKLARQREEVPRHAQQRALERTKVDPKDVAKLQKRVMGMELEKGQTYHHKWPQGGYSVIGPTFLGGNHRVKTTLAAHMRPPGVLLPA